MSSQPDQKVLRARALLRTGVEAYKASVAESITEIKSARKIFSDPVYMKNAAPIDYERYSTVCDENPRVSIIVSRVCNEKGVWLFENETTREEAVSLLRHSVDWDDLADMYKEIIMFDGLTASNIKVRLAEGTKFHELTEQEQDVWREYLLDNGLISDIDEPVTAEIVREGIDIMSRGTPSPEEALGN